MVQSSRMLRISCLLGASGVVAVQQQPWMVQQQGMQPAPAQPLPWMAPVQQTQQAQPDQEPAPGQNRYIYNFVPDNGMMCLQGPKGYLTAALERLRSSPMGPDYAGSRVTLGMCQSVSYTNGPFPGTCFPRAALYTDNDPMHVMTMLDFDQNEAKLYADARSLPVDDAMTQLHSACDDGTMETGLQLSLEESQAQVYVPPMASLIPDNGMSCMQGTTEYLQDALKQIKSTSLAELFENTNAPRRGMCAEHGYTVGSGGVVASGHGRVKSKCFPKATLFWDKDPNHRDLLMWRETRALKGPNRGFEFSAYDQRREQVKEMCSGKADSVYQPLPPNLM